LAGEGMKFGQLIVRKIIKIVAVRCQIVRIKINAPKCISAGVLGYTMLGELTAFSETLQLE